MISSTFIWVNEIGWSPSNNNICGRIVLSSGVSIGTTQFLQVQLQLVVTWTPGSPGAVGNVGTGINTAGSAMLETWDINQVTNLGTTGPVLSGGPAFDGGGNLNLSLITASYSQNSTPQTTANLNPTRLENSTNIGWTFSGNLGAMSATFSTVTFTTAAQIMYGFSVGSANRVCFDILLTTPFTLPTGTFFPVTVFQIIYSRALTN